MEILFENKCINNEKWAKEFTKVAYFHTPLFFTLHIISLALFTFGIIKLLLFRTIDIFCLFIPAEFIIVILISRFIRIKRTMKIKSEMYGENPEVISKATEDYFEQIHSNGMQYKILYDTIKRGYKTNDYIFLHSKANVAYSFSRNRFSVGTEQEFIDFLRRKGIKIK